MEAFSKRLKVLRTESNKLQADVSRDLNFSRGILSAYENGREPPFETLVAIARYFDVSTDYLLGLSSERRPAGDELSRTVDRAATATVQAGGEPVTASDLLRLAQHLGEYVEGGRAADLAPVDALRSLLARMDELLQALGTDNRASVFDACAALEMDRINAMQVLSVYLRKQDAIHFFEP